MNSNLESFSVIPRDVLDEQLDLLDLEPFFHSSDKLQAPPTWFQLPMGKGSEGMTRRIFTILPHRISFSVYLLPEQT